MLVNNVNLTMFGDESRSASRERSAGAIVWLESFAVLSECSVQVAQHIENCSEPRPLFGVFVREYCVLALTVEHCRSRAMANLRKNHVPRRQLPGG